MAITRLTATDKPQSVIVTAKIKTADGRQWEIPFRVLSWYEWDDLVKDVPNPKVPVVRQKDGPDKPDPNDPRYLEKLEDAGQERQARRIITALEGGGNTFVGDTLRQKYDYFKRQYDSVLVQNLVSVISTAHGSAQVQVEYLADSFRTSSESTSDDARMSANGYEHQPIPEPAN